MISIAIRAHPRRRGWVGELRRHLPGARVVWDERDDEWDTGRRALLAHTQTGSKWGLTIEDDAILARELAAALPLLAEAAGERPASLYLGRTPGGDVAAEGVAGARAAGTAWLEMPGPWWGVGVLLPTAHIPELVEWADAEQGNYDRRIARFYRRRRTPCLYVLPSLLDHRPERENPSLIPGHEGEHRAAWFCEGSALDVELDTAPHLAAAI